MITTTIITIKIIIMLIIRTTTRTRRPRTTIILITAKGQVVVGMTCFLKYVCIYTTAVSASTHYTKNLAESGGLGVRKGGYTPTIPKPSKIHTSQREGDRDRDRLTDRHRQRETKTEREK